MFIFSRLVPTQASLYKLLLVRKLENFISFLKSPCILSESLQPILSQLVLYVAASDIIFKAGFLALWFLALAESWACS